MDSPPPVTVRNLCKTFLINTAATTSLKEMVIKNLFAKAETVLHTALDDVSFTIEPGTCLAVVGGNGSGKSTLLKILSGISQPTSGSVEVRGRLSALLELGAGFQQEFTGMENIFLQCSIMGLQRPQILERLDDIIAFSELDKFIHTPVKHYSSGMYVRLGFAIAVHVDADVILLDEVLAVGDRSFQTKCLRKMRELRRGGAAMLFVSHNLEHIEAIADQVLWLEGGRVREHGSAADALPKFFEALQQGPDAQEEVELDLRRAAALPAARFKSSEAKMTAVRFLGADGQPRRTFDVEDSVIIEMDVMLARDFDVLEVQFGLSTMDAVRAVWVRSREEYRNLAAGAHRLTLELSDIHLRPGRHLASTMLGDPADDGKIYDMHVRTYAISLKGAPELHDAEGRLTPFGSFTG